MIRSVSLLLILAIARSAPAQDKPAAALETLRASALRASSNWEALAKGLEPKIARLLPCDRTARAAIENVSRASDVRLAAFSAYLRAASAQAKSDADAAKGVLAAQASLTGGWNVDQVEGDQHHTAIEAQIAELKESMRQRGSLAGAEQVLAEISNMIKERSAKSEEQASRGNLLNALLGSLVVASQDRQTALEKESALFTVEAAKWMSYYTARLARAVTECAIINPGTPKKP